MKARQDLPLIKSIAKGARLSEPNQAYNRLVLQVLQLHRQAATKKRKSSRHVVCRQCREVFDPEAEDGLENCQYHNVEFHCTTLGSMMSYSLCTTVLFLLLSSRACDRLA